MKVEIENKSYDMEVQVTFPPSWDDHGETVKFELTVKSVDCTRWVSHEQVHALHEFTSVGPTFDLAVAALYRQLKEVTFEPA